MTIKTWDIRLQELAGVLPEDISEDVAGWKFNDMEKCMKAEIDELRTASEDWRLLSDRLLNSLAVDKSVDDLLWVDPEL